MKDILINAISGLFGALVVSVPWYFRTKLKRMDHDADTKDNLWDRVKTLEIRLEGLQKEDMVKTKELAMLTARYELLQSEYEKSKTRVDELTVENMSLKKRVLELEGQVNNDHKVLRQITP